jgi:PAS domain S-box-containing protein
MTDGEEIAIYKRALQREKAARKQAEQILEERSLQLYESNQKLQELNESLESEIEARVSELREQENQLRHLVENNPFPLLIYDYETLEIVDLNQPASSFYGKDNELLGQKIYSLHPKEEQEEALATIKLVLTDQPIVFKEWHHLTCNGELKPVELHSSEITFNGRQSRLLLINDITERKKIEQERKLNQQKYQDLVEGASDIIYRCDMNGDFVYVNPTALYLTGYSFDELIKMNYLDLIHADYLQEVKEFYEGQLERDETSSYLEFPIQTKAGEIIWIGQKVNLQKNEHNNWEVNALARDITELKAARDSLERSENKYRNILENLKLGILEVDLDGRITNAYPKFTELSGYTREELIGKSPIEFLLPAEHRKTMTRQNVLRAQGKGSVYEVELITKSGERRWVIISGAPFYDNSGEIIGTVGIHLDITDRKRIEKELVQAKDLAENSVHVKELFMANMSHEIRTPMNAILGMSRLLSKTKLDNKQKEYTRALTFSAENLLLIINDILDFSKIESGNLELNPEPNDVIELCNDVIQLMQPKAEENNTILRLDSKTIHQRWFKFDKGRLNQVLINLVGNAIKFSPGGEVKLVVEKIAETEQTHRCRFSIIDTGIGIAAENQEKIFESFIQAEDSIEQKYGGTGLGLPISKRIVEKMGGTLEVVSAVNQGSSFYFEIDIEIDQTSEKYLDPVHEYQIEREGLNVLLVEDNEINIFMAQTILEELTCTVSIARNGLEAVEKVSQHDFDIVLMDMRMPEMNGIQATKIIREKLLITSLPIIALTANALKDDKEKCLNAGMDDFMSKPFERADLILMLNKYTKSAETTSIAPKKREISSYVDKTNLDKIAENNEVFKRQMIELFLVESAKEIKNITAAMKEQNWPSVSDIAHKLKPSLDFLSSKELREEVRAIESQFKEPNAADHLELLYEFLTKLAQLRAELSE